MRRPNDLLTALDLHVFTMEAWDEVVIIGECMHTTKDKLYYFFILQVLRMPYKVLKRITLSCGFLQNAKAKAANKIPRWRRVWRSRLPQNPSGARFTKAASTCASLFTSTPNAVVHSNFIKWRWIFSPQSSYIINSITTYFTQARSSSGPSQYYNLQQRIAWW